MKIWIDAGHGGRDPGAVLGSRMEKDDTLRFALGLERCFLERGCETVLTRRADTAVELSARTALERSAGCALAISCHRNAGGAGARGTEIWLHHAAQPSVVRWAADTALALEELGLPRRAGTAAPGVYLGYRTSPQLDYAVNRETSAPSMLLELGFLTSVEDNAVFDAECPAMCEAVATAACRFLGLEHMPEQEKPGSSPPGADYRALYLAERERLRLWWARAVEAEEALNQIHRVAGKIVNAN